MIYITPLYILLLLSNARQTINKLAAFFGAALSPFIYLFAGDWAILVAGFIGGTAALFVQRMRSAQSEKKSVGSL